MRKWRTRILDGILRGVLVIWLFATMGGINNIIKAYQQKLSLYSDLYENPLLLAELTGVIYVVTWGLLAFLTFNRKLHYELRAGVFLIAMYITGTIGLALSSLSGDD